jgi:hypothetical protein
VVQVVEILQATVVLVFRVILLEHSRIMQAVAVPPRIKLCQPLVSEVWAAAETAQMDPTELLDPTQHIMEVAAAAELVTMELKLETDFKEL